MVYRFGPFELDDQRFELRKAGELKSVEPLILRLLVYLIEHRDRTVPRAELFETLWKNRVVADAALYSAIKSVRAAVDDEGDAQRIIRTVSRTGYQFVAPLIEPAPATALGTPAATRTKRTYAVAAVLVLGVIVSWVLLTLPGGATGGPEAASAAPGTPGTPTVAVLPFVDLSEAHDQQAFADGLAEEMRDRLGRLPGLRVVGRTSSASFRARPLDLPAIAHALGAVHLLEGSVRKEAGRLRISAQLIDTQGRARWSQSYDRPLSDLFAVQSEVARSVATVLAVTLGAADVDGAHGRTTNVDAFEAYLAARAMMVDPAFAPVQDVRYGVDQLERAVRLDPDFALAWAWLALTYGRAMMLPERGTTELNERTSRAAERAMALAPDNAWSLVAQAVAEMQRLEWSAAERDLALSRERAGVSDNPWGCSGCFYLDVGQPAAALPHLQKAALADPLLPNPAWQIAHAYELMGQWDEAGRVLADAALLQDAGNNIYSRQLMHAMLINERPALRRLLQVSRGPNPVLDIMRKDFDRPRTALKRIHEEFPPRHGVGPPAASWWAGMWSAWLGDPELALQYMKESARDPVYAGMVWHPIFASMRRLPAFKDFVRELKLDEYWRASGSWGDFCRPEGDHDFTCN